MFSSKSFIVSGLTFRSLIHFRQPKCSLTDEWIKKLWYIYTKEYWSLKWSHSVASNSATPWIIAYQASPSMGFFGQEYWSWLPFPSPGDLPDPGIEPGSPTLEADALTSEPPGKPLAIKRNVSESVLMKWTNLEPVIQREISQKKKYKYCILMHICEI